MKRYENTELSDSDTVVRVQSSIKKLNAILFSNLFASSRILFICLISIRFLETISKFTNPFSLLTTGHV